jgi:hypothetical protein
MSYAYMRLAMLRVADTPNRSVPHSGTTLCASSGPHVSGWNGGFFPDRLDLASMLARREISQGTLECAGGRLHSSSSGARERLQFKRWGAWLEHLHIAAPVLGVCSKCQTVTGSRKMSRSGSRRRPKYQTKYVFNTQSNVRVFPIEP